MARYRIVEHTDDEFLDEIAGEVLAHAVDVDGYFADPLLPPRQLLVLRGCAFELPEGDLTLAEHDRELPGLSWDLVDPVVHATLPGGDVVLSASVCLYEGGPRGTTRGAPRPSHLLLQRGLYVGTCRAVEGLPVEPQGYRWPPITLIGCDNPDRIRTAPTVDSWGGIQPLDVDGTPMKLSMVKFAVAEVRPSVLGDGLFDVVLDQSDVRSRPAAGDRPPASTRAVWELWRQGAPSEKNMWAALDSAGRRTWLDLSRGRDSEVDEVRAGVYHVDGRFTTDVEGLDLALAEALLGPGRFRGRNQYELWHRIAEPITLVWHDAHVAHDAVRAYFLHVVTELRRHFRVTLELDSSLDGLVDLDRRSELGDLTTRWCRGWTKAESLIGGEVHGSPAWLVEVSQPYRHEYVAIDDSLTEIAVLAGEIAKSTRTEWFTVPTNSPEDVTRVLEHAGLTLKAPETFMRRSLADHPMPAAPKGYEVTVDRGDVIKVSVHREGALAASGLVAVVGTDAVPQMIVTKPEHQRRGLGSVVMGTLVREALADGADTGLLLASEDGRHLYTHLGWEVVADVVNAGNS